MTRSARLRTRPSSWTVLISLHAIAASYSLIFGAVNLLRRTKGGSVHRIVGRIWAGSMYVVVLTSFGIRITPSCTAAPFRPACRLPVRG